MAESYLTQKAGLTILNRNWRCRSGELDFVAQAKNGTVVFIEVKSRTSDQEGAWQAVNKTKQARLQRLAQTYLHFRGRSMETPCRFDAVAVDLSNGSVEHLENAFIAESDF